MSIIAIAIEKPEIDSPLSEVFGRSKYFLILSEGKIKSEILSNPFSSELGGAGIQSAKFLIEHNIDTLITKQIGVHPLRFLNSVNIKVFISNNNVKETLELFYEKKLKQLESIDDSRLGRRHRKRFGGISP